MDGAEMSFHRVSKFLVPAGHESFRVSEFPPPLKGGKLETGNCPGNSAGKLSEIAGQVARLSPDRRDPERFHLDKSEIVASLRRLAREIAA